MVSTVLGHGLAFFRHYVSDRCITRSNLVDFLDTPIVDRQGQSRKGLVVRFIDTGSTAAIS